MMMNFKSTNEMSISFIDSNNTAECLNEFMYTDTPNIISIADNNVQLIHPQYILYFEFNDNEQCREFYDNFTKELSEINAAPDMGDMGDIGDMFGDMFGQMSSVNSSEVEENEEVKEESPKSEIPTPNPKAS